MQKKIWYFTGAIAVLAIGVCVIASRPKKSSAPIQLTAQKQPATANNKPAEKNVAAINTSGVPAVANPSVSTDDPQDVVAGLYKNPIQNTSTQEGFTIAGSLVENNVDKAGKVIDDHLELALKNTVGKDLTDFEVYYQITDMVTGQKEGYYKKLTSFVLKSGETQSIHFDGGTEAGHFSANKNSLYYKSPNKMVFDVTVSTPGYKLQTVQISKDAGGAEQND